MVESKTESKTLREVRDYSRMMHGQKVFVKSYYQTYMKPRGSRNATMISDSSKAKSKTIWLKDNRGRFVGRANYQGKTSARRAATGGLDTTTNFREKGKYGRIYGRGSGTTEKRVGLKK